MGCRLCRSECRMGCRHLVLVLSQPVLVLELALMLVWALVLDPDSESRQKGPWYFRHERPRTACPPWHTCIRCVLLLLHSKTYCCTLHLQLQHLHIPGLIELPRCFQPSFGQCPTRHDKKNLCDEACMQQPPCRRDVECNSLELLHSTRQVSKIGQRRSCVLCLGFSVCKAGNCSCGLVSHMFS